MSDRCTWAKNLPGKANNIVEKSLVAPKPSCVSNLHKILDPRHLPRLAPPPYLPVHSLHKMLHPKHKILLPPHLPGNAKKVLKKSFVAAKSS